MQVTTHERTNENGYAYETAEIVDGNLIIGAHFKGQVAGLWDTLNELGLMGWEYIEDWNKHDSNYIEFQPRRGSRQHPRGCATFLEVVAYLKNKPFAVDWTDPNPTFTCSECKRKTENVYAYAETIDGREVTVCQRCHDLQLWA